jgi:hypothetical protein
MTEPNATTAQQLIIEGRAAALAGDTFAARTKFRQASELEPQNVEAWIGLGSVSPMLTEKRDFLLRALEIDPENAEAQASLDYVSKLQAQGYQLAPSKRREERATNGDASELLSAPEPTTPTKIEHCYRHPDRETGLHCRVCGRPICSDCATMTPVGQICPDDRKARRPRNYQVEVKDVIIAAVVAFFIAGVIGFFGAGLMRGFFAIFIAMFVGPAIAEFIVRISDYFTKAKRGRPMQIAVGVAIGLAMLPFVLANFMLIILAVICISTAVARLR